MEERRDETKEQSVVQPLPDAAAATKIEVLPPPIMKVPSLKLKIKRPQIPPSVSTAAGTGSKKKGSRSTAHQHPAASTSTASVDTSAQTKVEPSQPGQSPRRNGEVSVVNESLNLPPSLVVASVPASTELPPSISQSPSLATALISTANAATPPALLNGFLEHGQAASSAPLPLAETASGSTLSTLSPPDAATMSIHPPATAPSKSPPPPCEEAETHSVSATKIDSPTTPIQTAQPPRNQKSSAKKQSTKRQRKKSSLTPTAATPAKKQKSTANTAPTPTEEKPDEAQGTSKETSIVVEKTETVYKFIKLRIYVAAYDDSQFFYPYFCCVFLIKFNEFMPICLLLNALNWHLKIFCADFLYTCLFVKTVYISRCGSIARRRLFLENYCSL